MERFLLNIVEIILEPNYTHSIQSGEMQILIISGTKYESLTQSTFIKMYINV